MAEQVQAVLDSMVAPLRDYQERGIFSEEEIKAIVARRRESEYLVRRRAVRKADFLRYLEAELNLEKLRALRTKRVQQHEKHHELELKAKKKRDMHDAHVAQHVHFIFVRALRKFRSDVSLHLEHIAFCKSYMKAKLPRLYAEALQVHPRNVGLWIEAASHEFFEEKSVASARILLQRGLRVNPNSQDLWLQYFLLEFHHLQKLRGRREILQLQQQEEESQYDYSIPIVVYDNAIASIPDNVTFRLKFLDQCRLFPQTESVETHIMTSIGRDFSQECEAWIARAAFAAERNDNTEQAVGFAIVEEIDEEPSTKRQRASSPVLSVIEQATEALPTAEMYLSSIQFLRSYAAQQAHAETENEVKECNEFIHCLFREAAAKEIVSFELVLEEADALVQEGKLDKAIEVLQTYATSQEHVEAPVWLQWAKLCLGTNKSPSTILRKALDRTPLHSKEQMMILLELFGALLMEAADGESLEKKSCELQQLFQRMMLLSAGTHTSFHDAAVFGIDSVAQACLHYLLHVMSTGGIEAARRVYEQVLFQSNYGQVPHGKSASELEVMKEVIDECIRLEKAEKPKKKQILGRLYAAAIELFRDAQPAIADSYGSRRDNDVRYAY